MSPKFSFKTLPRPENAISIEAERKCFEVELCGRTYAGLLVKYEAEVVKMKKNYSKGVCTSAKIWKGITREWWLECEDMKFRGPIKKHVIDSFVDFVIRRNGASKKDSGGSL